MLKFPHAIFINDQIFSQVRLKNIHEIISYIHIYFIKNEYFENYES